MVRLKSRIVMEESRMNWDITFLVHEMYIFALSSLHALLEKHMHIRERLYVYI